jgi:hypothetical protein
MEVPLVDIYSLDFSPSGMLAAGAAGTRALSDSVDLAAAIPAYWYHREWGICSSYCPDHASSENSEWIESSITTNRYWHPVDLTIVCSLY